ncbi:hypothetical protein ABZ815_25530 [Nonomuraea sp. NPDC047529]|uniref:hypothetical protein n=1 Tax=Nonomuraea sp. NPDC047529 TaxID=3155623 RepID=UPI0033E4051C
MSFSGGSKRVRRRLAGGTGRGSAHAAGRAPGIAVLVAWDLFGDLPLGVAGHEGSTVIVGLNGLRLLSNAAWRRAAKPTVASW